MKTKTTTVYVCEKCQDEFCSGDVALECERVPVTQDKGAVIGDIVLITGGEGLGQRAKVSRWGVLSKSHGKRYHHTIFINADLFETWGSRMLLFDQYEVIK
jgi:hypothetical protein